VALAPLFSNLPKPVLAALIIEAVVMGMMDVPEMRRLAKVQRFDFMIAMAAVAGTLLFGVLTGVLIGIGLSLVWLISVATRPRMPLLGRTQVFR
jgi:MFS superfamily sulfate permease-like transporter